MPAGQLEEIRRTNNKIYISGPMTGLPDLNRSAFNAAAKALRAKGWDAVNPVDVCGAETDWAVCMRLNIAAMMACDQIVLLRGWGKSRGANVEMQLALDLKIRVMMDVWAISRS